MKPSVIWAIVTLLVLFIIVVERGMKDRSPATSFPKEVLDAEVGRLPLGAHVIAVFPTSTEPSFPSPPWVLWGVGGTCYLSWNVSEPSGVLAATPCPRDVESDKVDSLLRLEPK